MKRSLGLFRSLLLYACISGCGLSLAQEPAAVVSPSPRFAILVDNDMWGQPTPSDRSYTMGVSLSWLDKATTPSGNPWVNVLEGLNGSLGLAKPVKPGDPTGWLLANSAFTPQNLITSAPIRNDRPYASLLYGGPAYWSALDDGRIRETQLYLGLLGTGIGKSVQTWIHEHCCREKIPQGWPNQIGNGGSPTFLYHVRTITPVFPDDDRTWSIGYSAGGEVGYLTRAMIGASMVVGATPADRRNVYLMTFSNPTSLLKNVGSIKSAEGKSFWLDAELSLIAHNQLLQGAWSGENRVRIPYREIAPVVAKINAGVELTFLLHAIGVDRSSERRLYWTQSWRSRDLRHNSESKHFWGGFVFTTAI